MARTKNLRKRIRAASLPAMAIAVMLAVSSTALAIELWSDESGARSLSLNASLKSTASALVPDEWNAGTFWRLRVALRSRPTTWLSADLAYEPWASIVTETGGDFGNVDASPARAPYRIRQLSAERTDDDSAVSFGHEIDRAVVSVSFPRADLTVGRQAVGWGRGLLFGAVDIFAPFSALAVDREWRRGIDAIRLRAPLTDLVSVDAVAAFGETSDDSAFVGRIHGYAGDVDAELLAGVRRDDEFYGASMSLPVLDAELHGEAAVFLTRDVLPAGGSFGEEDVAVKTVLGGSRTFDLAGGLMVVAEYHYSGFGAPDIEDASDLLGDPAFLERYALGDSQVLGRHACALQLSYGFAGTAPLSATWVVSPVDGSGVIIPSVVWLFSDSVTFTANAYLAHGADTEDSVIRSEYGGTPPGALIQMSYYY